MLQNTKSQENDGNNNKNFSIKVQFIQLYNKYVRKKCREELVRTFGWNGSTFHNYMTTGISINSPYIPKILEIIEKYKEVEKRYIEKKEELD